MFIDIQSDWGMIAFIPTILLIKFDVNDPSEPENALVLHFLNLTVNLYWY